MNANVIVNGSVASIKPSKDPVTKQITGYSLQLIKRNGNNVAELLNVKLPQGSDPAKYAEGTHVELVVDVSTFKDNVYYRGVRDLRDGKTDARTDRPTPSAPAAAKPAGV